MDKKAWIVVIICCVLLGLNLCSNGKKDEDKQPAATAPADAAATKKAEQPAAEQKPAENQQKPEDGQPAAGQKPAETQPEADGQKAAGTQPQEVKQEAKPAEKPAAPVAVDIQPLVSHDADGNEVARFHFQAVGGSLRSIEMVGQAMDSTREEWSGNVQLNGQAPHGVGTIMFGLSSKNAPVYDRMVYTEKFRSENEVVLCAENDYIRVYKSYTLKPLEKDGETVRGNAYVVSLKIGFENKSATTISPENWGVYVGGISQISHRSDGFVSFIVEDDGSFEKNDAGTFSHWFKADEPFRFVSDCDDLEWVGLMNQYYATALRPDKDSRANGYYAAPLRMKLPVSGKEENGLEAGIALPQFSLSPVDKDGKNGGYKEFGYEYFAGPKYNSMLAEMGDDFRKIDRVMDYGMFYIISRPMNWLINLFYGLFGNLGWAIVAMTFVVRAIIWPLYRKSYVSMKRMSQLQPQMKELKEKYPNDPQRVQMEMMGLYRKYGINPLGGCLPMLLQMPIFLSFFWVLQTAAELRGAPWLGWVQDLSMPDTVCEVFSINVNVLPFLMIASMYIMMQMTPKSPGSDKTQRIIMLIMPVFFFWFCYDYASALALYWTTTNIISMIQLLIIRRLPMPELKVVDTKKKGGKKGFLQRMYDAQQAALKEQQQRQARMRNVTRK